MVRPDDVGHFDLNVSHQGDYAILATEENTRVGVDVMQVTRPRKDSIRSHKGAGYHMLHFYLLGGIGSLQQFFTTMTRQFTSNEWKQIQAPPSNEQKLAMFYRHWVRQSPWQPTIDNI